MNPFRNLAAVFLLILVSSFVSKEKKTAVSPYDPAHLFSVEELQEDFRVLRHDIEKRQPNLYLYSSKTQMDAAFDSLYNAIDRPMNFYEFYAHITVIESFIKDGHNLIAPGEAAGKYNDRHAVYFPLHVSYINGRLYSDMNYTKDTTLYDGAQVLSINGKSADDIHDFYTLRMVRDGYNQTLPDWIITVYFRGFYSFFTGFKETYTIDFAGRDGSPKKVSLPALPIDTILSAWRKKYPARIASQRKRLGLHLRFDSIPGTAVLTVQSFDENLLKKGYHQHFRRVMKKFFAQIDSSKCETLVLDVRDNGGGDPALSAWLLQQVMDQPFVYAEDCRRTRRIPVRARKERLTRCRMPGFGRGTFHPAKQAFRGKLIVLINGGSFSATGELASVLSRYKRAVFVGEETGGNNVICGGTMFRHRATLPHTRIVCLTGTEATVLRDLATNTGHGTMPDWPVVNSIDDIVANRDAVMEFALGLARQKQ